MTLNSVYTKNLTRSNPVRRHGNNNGLSPVKFERQYFERQAGV